MRRSELIGFASIAFLCLAALVFGRYIAGALETRVTARATETLQAIGHSGVQIDADGLVLELSGQVRSESDRGVVLTSINGMDGVSAVVDNLDIVTPLIGEKPATLQVQKDTEALTLSGEAPNEEARDLLSARAQLASAGYDFYNLMKMQERAADAGWIAAAEASIDAVAALRVGQAQVDRSLVRIVGAAHDAQARDSIYDALRRRLGDSFELEFEVAAPPPLISPYEFVARKTADGLTIERCMAPDARMRSVALGAWKSAGGASPAGARDGGCMVANGAPNDQWTDSVQRAIAVLASMEEGDIRIIDDQVRLDGFVPKGADIEAARDAAEHDWPAPYKLEIDIQEILPIFTPYVLTIVKQPGETRLTGYAPNKYAAARWTEALEASGATANLSLARGAPSEWEAAAEIVIDALNQLKIGSVKMIDESILLSAPGETSTRARLETRLSARLPANYRLDVVEAREPSFLTGDGSPAEAPEDPTAYFFVARSQQNAPLSISGVVENDATRAVIATYARAKFGGQIESDKLKVGAAEAPDGWQPALMAGLEALAKLGEGELMAEGGAVYLRGRATSGEEARAALGVLALNTPSEFTRFSRIAVREPAPPRRRVTKEFDTAFGDECVSRLNTLVSQEPISFQSGAATIDPKSYPMLDLLGRALAACQEDSVEIAGHTDSEGPEEINLALSQQRAAAIRFAFIARSIAPDILIAKGYGEAEPIADNSSAAGRAQNRRIEFRSVQ
ncbi:MAG: OmpA family protein [Pseudomonadota bacterium]